MPEVFVSHSSVDREFVETNIILPLTQYGVGTWYYKEDIPIGAEGDKRIKTGLETCDWFLVAISSHAINSDWVKAEVHWAFENRKQRIIPVLIAECDPGDLYLPLRSLQYVDFRHDTAFGRSQLLRCWGIDESDPTTSLGHREFFDILSGPTTQVTMVSLQRRAAKLSGESRMIGASTMFLKDDDATQKHCLFFSTILFKTYYLYLLTSDGEEVMKLHTDKFPPPNNGDKILKVWSTRPDKALANVMIIVKWLCPFNDLNLTLKRYECNQFIDTEKYLLRRNFFHSNYGDMEVGSKRETSGDTLGYIFFHSVGKVIQFVSDKDTYETAVIGQGDKRPF